MFKIHHLVVVMCLFFVVISCKSDSTPDSLENFSTKELSFETSGGSQNLTFTSANAYSITSSADWISVNPLEGEGGENIKISVKAEANESVDDRETKFTVVSGEKMETIEVKQKQKNQINVKDKEFSVDVQGGEIVLDFEANVDPKVEILDSWINVKTVKTKGLEAQQLIFVVSPNSKKDDREGKITLKTPGSDTPDEIKVIQEGRKLEIETDDFTIDFNKQNLSIDVSANIEYDVLISKNAENWITLNSSESKAVEKSSIELSITENFYYEDREAIILVRSKEPTPLYECKVKILQKAKDKIEFAEPSYEVPKEGGPLDITVSHNNELTIDIDVSWIKQVAEKTSSTIKLAPKAGIEPKELISSVYHFKVDANSGNEDRVANITFTAAQGTKASVKVVQKTVELPDIDETEIRTFLVGLYDNLSGDSWTRKNNWKSDKSVVTWTGVSYNKDKKKFNVKLNGNGLNGKLIIENISCVDSLLLNENTIQSISMKNAAIEHISVSKTSNLKSVDVLEGCEELKDLILDQTYLLSNLNIAAAKGLEKLDISSSKVKEIDLTGFAELKEFHCFGNREITSIDASNLMKLSQINVPRCAKLSTLKVDNSLNLNMILCNNCAIEELAVDGMEQLYFVECKSNKINREIPETLYKAMIFNHDQKYMYKYTGEVYKVNEYGWWYAGEPESGKHKKPATKK